MSLINLNNTNIIILFFTSNLGEKYGLELENYEEIKQLEKVNNIVFNFNLLKKIDIIVNDLMKQYDKILIYIDFCNSNMNILLNLIKIYNYNCIHIIFKFKGYNINNDFLNIINSFSPKNKMLFLTTSSNIINNDRITFIKYWRIDLNNLSNIELNYNKSIIYEDYMNNLINDNKKYYTFVFIGRKDKFKQINLVIETYIKLYNLINTNTDTNTNIRLLMIGSQKDSLIFDKNKNIFNIPFLDNINCLYLLKKYGDCLFLPSLSEGFGRVYIEALYLNKIVLITKNSMFSDDIKNVEPELIITPEINSDDDKNKIVNKMLYCINNHHNILNNLINNINIEKYNKQDLIEIILNNLN